MYDCVRNALRRTGTHPKNIDILVINCSLFSPTPSLCSMVINEFGMRTDVSSYNLSGMVRYSLFVSVVQLGLYCSPHCSWLPHDRIALSLLFSFCCSLTHSLSLTYSLTLNPSLTPSPSLPQTHTHTHTLPHPLSLTPALSLSHSLSHTLFSSGLFSWSDFSWIS